MREPVRRWLGAVAAIVASLSGLCIALWLLAIVFCGSLEVMRR